jgi:hypothetical protein
MKDIYKCLAPMPNRKYRTRREYLEKAIPKGLHKKLLVLNGEVVGQIEHVLAEASGYPIIGDNIIVMNCIWVLRKAKRHNLGLMLIKDMVESEKNAAGFATIALEGERSPWFKKWQMERLGFKPTDSIKVKNKRKPCEQAFTIYLMWMPKRHEAEPPTWDKAKLLEGETFCSSHPLYRPQTWEGRIFDVANNCLEKAEQSRNRLC